MKTSSAFLLSILFVVIFSCDDSDVQPDSTEIKIDSQGEAYAYVEDFGATGDGSTDDSDAIQNAINSVARFGGTVYFRREVNEIDQSGDGTYSNQFRAGNVKLKSNVNIDGGGAKITLLDTAYEAIFTTFDNLNDPTNTHPVQARIANVAIRNLILDGNSASRPTSGHGIFVGDIDNFTVENCVIQNVAKDAILCYRLRNCFFRNNTFRTIGTDGVSLHNSHRIIVESNNFGNVGYSSLGGSYGGSAIFSSFDDFEDDSPNLTYDPGFVETHDVIISNNIIEGPYSPNNALIYNFGIVLQHTYSFIISDNFVKGNTANGIVIRDLSGYNHEADNNHSKSIISGNRLVNNGLIGYSSLSSITPANLRIDVEQSTSTTVGQMIITNNIFDAPTNDESKYNVYIDRAKNVILNNNLFTIPAEEIEGERNNKSVGTFTHLFVKDGESIQVDNNQFIEGHKAILINRFTNSKIDGNILDINSVGILMENSVDSKGISIVSNKIRNISGTRQGQGIFVKSNAKYFETIIGLNSISEFNIGLLIQDNIDYCLTDNLLGVMLPDSTYTMNNIPYAGSCVNICN